MANDPQGVDKFDVFAVPYSYDYVPVEVTDVTVVDERTVNLTFNQAVTLEHECEMNHPDNVHWYFRQRAAQSGRKRELADQCIQRKHVGQYHLDVPGGVGASRRRRAPGCGKTARAQAETPTAMSRQSARSAAA